MKINLKGLKFKNWLYLMGFSLIILGVLWVLQFLFLNQFYQKMKLNEIKKIGDKIVEQLNNEDFHNIMNEYAFQNNLRVILLDKRGNIAVNFDGFLTDSPAIRPPGIHAIFPESDFKTAIQNLQENDFQPISYLKLNAHRDVTQAIYVANFVMQIDSQEYFLYISSPIPEIDSTITVLKTQFVIITIILVIMSLVVAQMISKKLSKPIINLTEAAERLVKGELNIDFYDNEFTEIHQLATTMNFAAKELRNIDNYRKEFIANISHDLKTPLTIIKFYGEMIKDISGDNPKKRNEHCDIIIKETDWLTGMVGEILELSKLESDNAKIFKTKVNLSDCLADVMLGFKVLVEKDGYLFETSIEKDLHVFGNEPMIRRAIYNLISNAINFTGEDKRIHIVLKRANNKIRFEVSDTGAGIPVEKQDNIWDRYYKSGEPHKRAVVGFGLGLSIVKNILINHNAEYGVISTTGKGSTFWFQLGELQNY